MMRELVRALRRLDVDGLMRLREEIDHTIRERQNRLHRETPEEIAARAALVRWFRDNGY